MSSSDSAWAAVTSHPRSLAPPRLWDSVHQAVAPPRQVQGGRHRSVARRAGRRGFPPIGDEREHADRSLAAVAISPDRSSCTGSDATDAAASVARRGPRALRGEDYTARRVESSDVADRVCRHPAAVDPARKHLADVLADFPIDERVQLRVHPFEEIAVLLPI